jgi:hypothetical protein
VRAIPSLAIARVALFCVFLVRAGRDPRADACPRPAKGGRVIAEQPYALARPRHGDHVLPTECMVRIRRPLP